MSQSYNEVNGTSYHLGTSQTMIDILERLRTSQERVQFLYGDTSTGRAWGDVEVGRIGRSTGNVKVPLVIPNRSSMGGGALLDHCIVGIQATQAPHRWIYKHPQFDSAN